MITVKKFIEGICTRVKKKEAAHYVELMMDNHKCIDYGGVQYYIPEDETLNRDEELIYDFLINNYLL